MAEQPRWLVLNKMDMVPEDEREERCRSVVDALQWSGPIYRISAIDKGGVQPLLMHLQDFLDQRAEAFAADPELLEQEKETRALIDAEARLHIQRLRDAMRARREAADSEDDDDFNDDDYDIEVEYVR